MKIVGVVLNASAGNKSADKEKIKEVFTGDEKVVFFNIQDGVKKIEKSARNHKLELIVAGGGDGTVNAVAQIAIALQIPLAVLPLGTLNHFAKDLGLPQDVEGAVNVILKGKLSKIDYCTVNGNLFLNNSSIGIYPAAVRERDKIKKHIGKWLAMAISSLRTLLNLNTLTLSLKSVGIEKTFRTPLLFVGNNSYEYSKLGFTNRKSLTGGELFVYVVRSITVWSLLRTAVCFFFGMKDSHGDYMKLTKKQLTTYTSKKRLHVSLDGEVLSMQSPLIYDTHPAGLIVCVP
jgi:diacylglycerol kinase family enzyme